MEEVEIGDKIYRQDEELGLEEMEAVSYSQTLRDRYNFRWWQVDSTKSYFIMYNYFKETAKAGEQVFYAYG